MTRTLALSVAGALVASVALGPSHPATWSLLAFAWALAALRLGVAIRRHRRRHSLDALRRLSPPAFERRVGAWLARDGWLVEHHGRSGDHGVDLLAFHGDQVLAVQCKRYAEHATVTPAQVRELYGAAAAVGATAALLVTTGRVSRNAEAWRESLRSQTPRLDFLAGDSLAAIAAGHAAFPPAVLR